MNLFELFVKIGADTSQAEKGMKDTQKNSETLTNKMEVMSAQFEKAQKNVDELTKKFNESVQKTGATSKETQELADKLNKAEKEAADAKKALDKYNDELNETEEKTEKAHGGLSKFIGGLGKGLGTAAKIGGAAVAAAAAGIAKLTTAAVKNYAEYEQLVGGVDTLFKGASQKVQQYAAEAYRTSGMSANDYMANATAFSASLISALGDDTEAAAEYANRAMVSMSDNANRMGTSLDSIVQTYQSLARGNFAMLDNLKLGYGGTKEELERLIADAASYTEIQKEMGITVDASSTSFDNIVNAIAVVQGKLGIAGATAQEAGTTIEGSVNSMKSAWQNLITGLADGNADIGQLVDNLVTTIVGDGTESNLGVLGNVLPAVETAIGGVGTLVEKLLPKIVERIPELLTGTVPKLLKSAVDTLKTVINGIAKNAKIIVQAAKDLVLNFIDGMVDMLPDIIDAAIELLSGILEAIPEIAGKLIQEMPQIIGAIVEGLGRGAQAVLTAVVGLFSSVDEEFDASLERMKKSAKDITPFTDSINAVKENAQNIEYFLTESGKSAKELGEAIVTAEDNISNAIRNSKTEDEAIRQEELTNLRNYIDEYKLLVGEKLGLYSQMQDVTQIKIEESLDTADIPELGKRLGEAQQAYNDFANTLEESYSYQIAAIDASFSGTSEYSTELAKITAWYNEQKAQADSALAQSSELIYSEIEKRASESYDALEQVIYKYDNLRFDELSWIEKKASEIELNKLIPFGGPSGVKLADYADDLASFNELYGETVNSYLTMTAQMVDSGKNLSDSSKSNIEKILGMFAGLPEQYDEIGKDTLVALTNGIESAIPELEDTANMSVDEIIEALESALGVDASNAYGEDAIAAIAEGINNKSDAAGTAADTVAGKVIASFDELNLSAVERGKQFVQNYISGIVAGIPELQAVYSAFGFKFDSSSFGTSNGEKPKTTNNNIGQFTVNVNVPNGQDVEGIADMVIDRINSDLLNMEVVS